jgi:hypothetical protein
MPIVRAQKKPLRLRKISPADASALSILVQAKPETRELLLQKFAPTMSPAARLQARRLRRQSAKTQAHGPTNLPLRLVPA